METGVFHRDRATQVRAGTGAATEFQHLYETQFLRIIRFLARRGVPRGRLDDLVQEIFARAWAAQSDHLLDPAFPKLLWGIVKNVLREKRRSGAAGLTKPFTYAGELPACDSALPPEEIERKERIEQVQAALASLSVRQRQAVELVEMSDLTIEQAAKVAGCTPGSLQWHRRMAMRSLRKLLVQQSL